jgi:hypothetical protein
MSRLFNRNARGYDVARIDAAARPLGTCQRL